ncbi:hypothetical protein TNIN_430141 [Trichonephila inaurata madagascariensis]|uniref:Uncharacterized protein n=1 Tax=Trichonephila inaurata madagascariensis TaxID=2747483 RepID=A0A8X7C8G1_9ARAC|nr:hypothetical protein TNIN_430141 [Trichonephila inaurata madagascariensis]
MLNSTNKSSHQRMKFNDLYGSLLSFRDSKKLPIDKVDVTVEVSSQTCHFLKEVISNQLNNGGGAARHRKYKALRNPFVSTDFSARNSVIAIDHLFHMCEVWQISQDITYANYTISELICNDLKLVFLTSSSKEFLALLY